MIYIDRKKVPIPKVLGAEPMTSILSKMESFYGTPPSERSQSRFDFGLESLENKLLMEDLVTLFNNKCAYCESSIGPKDIAELGRFRPPSGARGLEKDFDEDHYWWLSFDWHNLYLVCQTCSRHKASWFPVEGERAKNGTPYDLLSSNESPLLIDPCYDNPEEHFVFREEGVVDIRSSRGKVTIDLLDLNRDTLRKGRRLAAKHLRERWEEIKSNWNSIGQQTTRIEELAKEWNEILTGKSKAPYLAVARAILAVELPKYPGIQRYIIGLSDPFGLEGGLTDLKMLKTASPLIVQMEEMQSPLTPHLDEFLTGDLTGLEMQSADFTSVIHTNQVFLESIELSNFMCFDQLKLDLSPGRKTSPDREAWHLLLGENGVGKSSVLKAISIALMGDEYRSKLSRDLHPKKLLKQGKHSGYIKLIYNESNEANVEFSSKDDVIKANVAEPPTNLIGYGSVRLLPKNGIKPEDGIFNGIKVGNLFDYSIAMNNANEWLLSLPKKEFERAATSLKDLMLLDDDLIRDQKKKEIRIRFSDGRTSFIDDLSDGYKTVYAMTADIMSTLSSENLPYYLAQGIVLIDEIGTHLHPRWKMQVVERLRKAFPKLQFVVSSHEPLCLRGLGAGEVIVLSKNEKGQIVAQTDLPDPSELRVDQILTSEFFGLRSTIDAGTEALFEEYYTILAKDDADRNPNEVRRLLELSEMIPRMKHLGDNIREDLVYYVIDELLAKKVKDEGLKISEELKKEALSRVEFLWNNLERNDTY